MEVKLEILKDNLLYREKLKQQYNNYLEEIKKWDSRIELARSKNEKELLEIGLKKKSEAKVLAEDYYNKWQEQSKYVEKLKLEIQNLEVMLNVVNTDVMNNYLELEEDRLEQKFQDMELKQKIEDELQRLKNSLNKNGEK